MFGLTQMARARSSLLKQIIQPARLASNAANTKEAPAKYEKTVNTVTLMGRVGADPQKRGNEQHPVVIFSLATHLNYKYESGEQQQKTEWHRICCFRPGLRDLVYQYVQKGQRVYVTGRLTYGEITDAEGVQRATTAIIADDVIFMSGTPKSA
ncbi:Hypothetical predicted protein [Cloeon dipterum]|uniref:Single-stranded DNA-binding protein n=1 Tax=Cloeon dipterum TaxID=197152 RepID=A0A8S1CJ95_9INSE|nr:Hypothetical predicted protein [Cloeon dipterum]